MLTGAGVWLLITGVNSGFAACIGAVFTVITLLFVVAGGAFGAVFFMGYEVFFCYIVVYTMQYTCFLSEYKRLR